MQIKKRILWSLCTTAPPLLHMCLVDPASQKPHHFNETVSIKNVSHTTRSVQCVHWLHIQHRADLLRTGRMLWFRIPSFYYDAKRTLSARSERVGVEGEVRSIYQHDKPIRKISQHIVKRWEMPTGKKVTLTLQTKPAMAAPPIRACSCSTCSISASFRVTHSRICAHICKSCSFSWTCLGHAQ